MPCRWPVWTCCHRGGHRSNWSGWEVSDLCRCAASVVATATTPLKWRLKDAKDRTVATGATRVVGDDKASGDHVHQADFSRTRDTGTYRLTVEGAGTSVPFTVTGKPLYPDLGREAMQYFYDWGQVATTGTLSLLAVRNDLPAAKSYAGPDTAPSARGSKENTVNWNAPLVWVATYLASTDLAR